MRAARFTWSNSSSQPVPEDWKLCTTVGLPTLWELWFVGSPPLKDMNAGNVPGPKSQRKRFNEMRMIMGGVQEEVRSIEGAWIAEPAVAQV